MVLFKFPGFSFVLWCLCLTCKAVYWSILVHRLPVQPIEFDFRRAELYFTTFAARTETRQFRRRTIIRSWEFEVEVTVRLI